MEEFTKMQQLDIWIEKLIFPGESKNFIQDIEESSIPNVETRRKFVLYTEEHQYIIVAINRERDEGYLGCQVQVRKARAGEDWLRGNDLPDGSFNEETWNNIINSIVRYELVKLTKYLKPEVGDIKDVNFKRT